MFINEIIFTYQKKKKRQIFLISHAYLIDLNLEVLDLAH
jgi:hypothetical protein